MQTDAPPCTRPVVLFPSVWRAMVAAMAVGVFAIGGCGGSTSSGDATGSQPTSVSDNNSAGDTTPSDSQAEPPAPPPEPPAPDNPRADASLAVLPGFQAEVLYDVPGETQGSWVALCAGPDGTLFAADQYGETYRVTPPPIGDYETQALVEPLGLNLGGAQGLCWAFDSLYIMVTGKGLYRVTDSDGDGTPDAAEHIVPIEQGGGEHGQHAVILSHDGDALIVCCGNHIDLPEITASRVPRVWGEDLLLKREWDANGHAAGKLAPGGFILEVSPDGSDVELISIGYRNQYDIALNRHGELFTYDADMEWDMGAPWYRPTRVCHAVSGSEFGWRSGTGKWPTYFPDSLPPVVDIGPGSPTGVLFGTGAAFPHRYQDALFLLDWTFGTMYAVHLKPDGATYTGEVEEFVSGKPLPLTDAVIGGDGAMYVATGGRRLASKLYRIHYYGNRDTSPVPALPAPTAEARLRHELEALHTPDAEPDALDTIWPALGHDDRFVRYAARTALEHQPVDTWRQRALDEENPAAAVEALLALARHGNADDLTPLLVAANRLDLDALSTDQRLALMRLYALAFIRLDTPNSEQRTTLIQRLDPRFPSADDDENVELARLLVYLNSPTVIDKCLELMNTAGEPERPDWAELIARHDRYGGDIQRMIDNPPPTRKLNYAFMLRNITDGWTLEQRQAYFLWLHVASQATGGNSYAGFINMIRDQALAACDNNTRASIQAMLAALPVPDDNQPPLVQPVGPGRAWTTEQAVAAVRGHLTGRDYDRGAGLYRAALCAQCHRFNGFGGSVGPDLTSVASTYSLEDLLSNIIQPSRDITDQYAWSIVTMNSGDRHVGRIVQEADDTMRLATNFLDPSQTVDLAEGDIASIEPYPVSPMQVGLVNPMSEDELRDLVAYLLSGGDRDSAMFD